MSKNIRNFSIIAHIDHGKTTLTDCFLRLTHTVSDRDFSERMMDSNPIEQERGITIKLAPVRMNYLYQSEDYILNLIDTPGHVDFGYEVSRSLAACEGAILLIDVSQGVQAQTLANYEKARELGLTIIPVLNKVDLPSADVEAVSLEVMETFGIDESEIVLVSAKTALNVEKVLQTVIEKVPPPQGDINKPLRSLIFTSQFHPHKGVEAYIRVVDGVLKRQNLKLLRTNTEFLPLEIGIFSPQMVPVEELKAGEVGYVSTGLKEVAKIKVGDTLVQAGAVVEVEPLPGYHEPTPMVYMQFYPLDGDDFVLLQDAVGKLALHDSSLAATGVHSIALGNGLRIGFLGLLHADIIRERLEREFNLDLIATTPTVPYEVLTTRGEELVVHSPSELPDPSLIKTIREPMTKATIITPESYVGAIIKLCREHRGELVQVEKRGLRTQLTYTLPLYEIIISFHDQLKSVSSGYASLEYEVTNYLPVDAVKLDIIVHGETIEALSQIVIKDEALRVGRVITRKLKEVLPRQMFEIPIQAAVGGSILSRETIKAYRKDVTAKLYGGDVTRRMKLLRKQARGKKKMKQIGKVELNQEAFLAVLER
jgi:GTP-binding protein LepA